MKTVNKIKPITLSTRCQAGKTLLFLTQHTNRNFVRMFGTNPRSLQSPGLERNTALVLATHLKIRNTHST